MSSTYDEIMAESSDEELVNIVHIEPYNFGENALSAARAALASRKLSEAGIEQIRQEIARKRMKIIEQNKRRSFKYTFWHIFLPPPLGFLISAFIEKCVNENESK